MHDNATVTAHTGTDAGAFTQTGTRVCRIAETGTRLCLRGTWTGTDPTTSAVVSVYGYDRLDDDGTIADGAEAELLASSVTISGTEVGTSPTDRKFGTTADAIDCLGCAAVVVVVTTAGVGGTGYRIDGKIIN